MSMGDNVVMTLQILTNYIAEAIRHIAEDERGLSYASLVALPGD